jgi:hypothetical protein
VYESIGSLFRVGTEYDRRELCVKEKEVPYVVAGCEKSSSSKTGNWQKNASEEEG